MRHGDFIRIDKNGTVDIGTMFNDSREGQVDRKFLDTTLVHSFYEDDCIDFEKPSIIIEAPVYSNEKFMKEVLEKMMTRMPRTALLTYLGLYKEKKIQFS